MNKSGFEWKSLERSGLLSKNKQKSPVLEKKVRKKVDYYVEITKSSILCIKELQIIQSREGVKYESERLRNNSNG